MNFSFNGNIASQQQQKQQQQQTNFLYKGLKATNL